MLNSIFNMIKGMTRGSGGDTPTPIASGPIRIQESAPVNEKIVLLDIPYNTQRDNKFEPSSACNVTSLWMLLHEVCIKLDIEDDDLIKYLEDSYVGLVAKKKCGSWVNSYVTRKELEQLWIMLEWLGNVILCYDEVSNKPPTGLPDLVKKLGMVGGEELKYEPPKQHITFKYRTVGSIMEKIDEGHGVIIGGKTTPSGHYFIAIGYIKLNNDNIFLVVHDPWGDWTGAYKNHNGASRIYSFDSLSMILHTDGYKSKLGEPMFRSIAFEGSGE